MKEFTFVAEVTVSAYTVVHADTAEEARRLVEERDVEIGGRGTGVSLEDVWVIEEANGIPQILYFETEEIL